MIIYNLDTYYWVLPFPLYSRQVLPCLANLHPNTFTNNHTSSNSNHSNLHSNSQHNPPPLLQVVLVPQVLCLLRLLQPLPPRWPPLPQPPFPLPPRLLPFPLLLPLQVFLVLLFLHLLLLLLRQLWWAVLGVVGVASSTSNRCPPSLAPAINNR